MKRNNPSPSGYAKRPFGACVVDRHGRRLPQPPALVGNTGSSSWHNAVPSSGQHQGQGSNPWSNPPPSAIDQTYQPGPSQHPPLVGYTGSSSLHNATPGSSQHQVQGSYPWSYPPPSAVGQNYPPGPSQHPSLVGYTGSSSLHNATPSSSQHQGQGSNPWSYPPPSAIDQNYQPGPSHRGMSVIFPSYNPYGSNTSSSNCDGPWSFNSGSRQDSRGAVRGDGRGNWGGTAPANMNNIIVNDPSREDTRQSTQEMPDIVNFKHITLISNFFECIHHWPNRTVYKYRVDFKPADVDTRDKITFLQPYLKRLPTNVFDGGALFVIQPLKNAELKMLNATNGINHDYITQISTRQVQVAQTGKVIQQICTIVIKNCLIDTGLQAIDGVFCDEAKTEKFDFDRVEVWQGHKISMGKHEDKNILKAEFDHKMILHYNCLQIIKKYGVERSRLLKEILGKIVKTIHDRKTYRVDDIDWNLTPRSTLLHNREPITFVDYFKIKNGLDIKDLEQPLFISRPTMKDFNSRIVEPIQIIPELCQLTDYTEEMLSNFKLTSAVTTHMQKEPTKHVEELIEFSDRLQTPNVVSELQNWGLEFPKGPEKIQGSEIWKQTIKFGNDKDLTLDDKCNWYQALEHNLMIEMMPLKQCVLIYYEDTYMRNCVSNFISALNSEATKLNYQMPPYMTYKIRNNRIRDYVKEVDFVMNTFKNTIQLVLVILPKYSEDIWSAVYQRASVYFGDIGVATQCVEGGLFNMPHTNVSMCRNLVIKINTKLGGVPWTVNIASETTMFVGFDFYRSKKGNRVISVRGMVASIDKTCSKYFSTASFHPENMPLYSAEIGEDLKKCLNAYRDKTKMLPNSIIMYRTEICDWQRYKVDGIELKAMKVAISDVYKNARLSEPTLTVIMPSKQSNSRFFSQVRHEIYANPRAGTVIDGNITSPERYNFYLLSHVCTESQHTATPTSYSVLCDPEGLNPENLLQHRRKIQLLTYQLCHLYYNCCSTVALPAPFKYAQDLVDFIGKYLKGAIPPDNLSHDFYYL